MHYKIFEIEGIVNGTRDLTLLLNWIKIPVETENAERKLFT